MNAKIAGSESRPIVELEVGCGDVIEADTRYGVVEVDKIQLDGVPSRDAEQVSDINSELFKKYVKLEPDQPATTYSLPEDTGCSAWVRFQDPGGKAMVGTMATRFRVIAAA